MQPKVNTSNGSTGRGLTADSAVSVGSGLFDPAVAVCAPSAPSSTVDERKRTGAGDRRNSVDHPSHYNTGKIEVIDFLEDQHLGFHAGNVVKYVCRASHKGHELEDLKKARWYLDRLIQIKSVGRE